MLAAGPAAQAEEAYRQLPAVIEVHTTFDAGGHFTLDRLVERARRLGVEVLVPTDHDLQAMQYGVPPFRNLLRKRVERRSIIEVGSDQYLAAVDRINQAQQDVLVVPGAQSSPFYYWTGRPFSDDFTAHQYRKELLVIGMREPAAYEDLPLLHNGFSTRWVGVLLPRFLVLLAAAAVAFWAAWRYPAYRRSALILAVVGLLAAADAHPFKSSRFDPYHGDQGIGPFQDLIDYVGEHGGLVFWSHPESLFSLEGRRLGPVVLKTPKYLEDLDRSSGYTGFTALYGDATTAEKPGGKWDRLLAEYCNGKRPHPVWAIAGADYHKDLNWLHLDTFQTVLLAKDKSYPAVMDALASGRMYALLKNLQHPRLVLADFRLTATGGAGPAVMGETLEAAGPAEIEIRLDTQGGAGHEVRLELVRNGKVVHTERGETPLAAKWVDNAPPQGTSFYRLVVHSPTAGRLLSNPVFLRRR